MYVQTHPLCCTLSSVSIVTRDREGRYIVMMYSQAEKGKIAEFLHEAQAFLCGGWLLSHKERIELAER